MSESNDKQDRKLSRISHKTEVTARISETSRFVGVGIVAWVFAQHASGEAFAVNYLSNYGAVVRFAGVLGVLVILFDYLQYIAAYASVRAALKNEGNDYAYDDRSLSMRMQMIFFWAKQFAAVVAAMIIVISFAGSISALPLKDEKPPQDVQTK